MDKMHYEHYLPVVMGALTVFLLGMWNPKFIRESADEQAKRVKEGGAPSSFWLAVFALIVGMMAVWFYNH